MKKLMSLALALTMIMSVFVMPASAATASKQEAQVEFQPKSFTIYFYKDGSTVKKDSKQANNKEYYVQASKLNEVVGSATVTITRRESGNCYMSWDAYSYGGYFIKEAKIKLLCKKSGFTGPTYYKKENSKKGKGVTSTEVSGYTDLFGVPNSTTVTYGISDFNMTFYNYKGTVKAYNQMWETVV